MYRKLNWKIILINLTILWFFAHGFRVLGYLLNPELAMATRTEIPEVYSAKHTTAELSSFVAYAAYAYMIGDLIAFLVCSLFSNRGKIDFIEAAIALIVFTVASYFGWTGWSVLKYIFLAPGEFSKGVGYFLTNGLVMLFIAIGLLFIRGRRLSFKPALRLTGASKKPGRSAIFQQLNNIEH